MQASHVIKLSQQLRDKTKDTLYILRAQYNYSVSYHIQVGCGFGAWGMALKVATGFACPAGIDATGSLFSADMDANSL
jgi:hypothetical protein